jgi:glycosyltransferase involved in cell wall biosynthesis
MTCGVPCVASDCEGVTDVLTDGKDGLVVPRGDIAALCKALKRVASDEALRRRLSEAGQQRVQASFGIERVIGQIFPMYDRMLGLDIECSSSRVQSQSRLISL